MKKIAFINSHLYSGAPDLYDSLNKNPYIQGFRSDRQRIYLNNYDFFQLFGQNHKIKDKHAIYLDEIYYNYALSTRMDLSKCYFIHLIRSPECLNLAFFQDDASSTFVVRKYLYRLRRICEIAKRAPNSLFLTFEDLKNKKSMELIKDFLSLKETPLMNEIKEIKFKKDLLPYELIKKAEEGYELYLAFLRQQNLLQLV